MPTEKFFFTENTPYQWSSGPNLYYFNPETWEEIASLEEAKQLAIANQKGDPGRDDFVRTTYGIEYSLD